MYIHLVHSPFNGGLNPTCVPAILHLQRLMALVGVLRNGKWASLANTTIRKSSYLLNKFIFSFVHTLNISVQWRAY